VHDRESVRPVGCGGALRGNLCAHVVTLYVLVVTNLEWSHMMRGLAGPCPTLIAAWLVRKGPRDACSYGRESDIYLCTLAVSKRAGAELGGSRD